MYFRVGLNTCCTCMSTEVLRDGLLYKLLPHGPLERATRTISSAMVSGCTVRQKRALPECGVTAGRGDIRHNRARSDGALTDAGPEGTSAVRGDVIASKQPVLCSTLHEQPASAIAPDSNTASDLTT